MSRRRELRVRQTRWAQATARALTRRAVSPNQVSLLGITFAVLGAGALLTAGWTQVAGWRVALLLTAAGCVQGRLLCNLFDGLIAVEGGRRTKNGEIYNELPDRFSDILFLAAAGYVESWTGWERELGWLAAALAVTTAYVRAFGGELGAGQLFSGPMAKQHRMATLTAACVASGVEVLLGWPLRAMTLALGAIVIGALWTVARRTAGIARFLENR